MATITALAGGGNWNATGTWDTGAVPGASDDVKLDGTSGNVVINVTSNCRSIDCTGYTGTLSHSAGIALGIGGSVAGTGNVALKFVAGMTYTNNASAVNFNSTVSGTTQTIDFAGKSLGFIGFGTTGNYQLTGSVTTNATFSFTNGTLDFNGQTVTCSSLLSSGTNTRTLTFGAANITCSGSTPVSFSGTGLTLNAGTSTITSTTGSPVFVGGGNTFYNVVLTTSLGNGAVTGANTFNNFSATSIASKTTGITFNANQTINGTLTLNGNSAINRLLISTPTLGTNITLTCAAVSFSYADFQDITGAGAASWNLSAITGLSGDCGGNSGITFTTAATQTATGTASFSWSTHGWTSRVPLPQDDVSIPNAFVAGRLITADMPRSGKSITCTCTGNPQWTQVATSIFGNFTFATGMTTTGSNALTLAGRSGGTITTNGVSITQGLTVACPGATYTLQDNWTTSGAPSLTMTIGTLDVNGKTVSSFGVFTHTAGTFNVNAGTVTVSSYSSNNSNTRVLALGTAGTLNLSSTATATVWNVASGTWSYTGTGTIAISTASANTRGFSGGGFSYPKLQYIVSSSAGQLTISGANTFTDIDVRDGVAARNLVFPITTTTIVTGSFVVQGSVTNSIWILSGTSGTQTTLSSAAGAVNCEYVQIRDIVATGGTTWYAGATSTDLGNNTGWTWSSAPAGSVITKTQSAISRIAINSIYGQSALARLAVKPTKTQAALARVAIVVTKLQTAIARIAALKTTAQTALARIAITGPYKVIHSSDFEDGTTQTWSGAIGGATVANSSAQAHSGTKSLQMTTGSAGQNGFNLPNTTYVLEPNRLYTLTAWVYNPLGVAKNWQWQINLQDSSGVLIVQVGTTATTFLSAGAWTQVTFTFICPVGTVKGLLRGYVLNAGAAGELYYLDDVSTSYSGFSQPAIARIAIGARTNPQTAKARIAATVAKTQPAVARIAAITTKTQTATAKIILAGSATFTQSAIARIARNFTKTQTAIARIAYNVTKTQTAIARVAVGRTLTQTAVARIARSVTKTQSATARAAVTKLKTQLATARVLAAQTKTQTATSRVKVVRTKTQTATARIHGGTLYDLDIFLDRPSVSVEATVQKSDLLVTVENRG